MSQHDAGLMQEGVVGPVTHGLQSLKEPRPAMCCSRRESPRRGTPGGPQKIPDGGWPAIELKIHRALELLGINICRGPSQMQHRPSGTSMSQIVRPDGRASRQPLGRRPQSQRLLDKVPNRGRPAEPQIVRADRKSTAPAVLMRIGCLQSPQHHRINNAVDLKVGELRSSAV